MVGEICFIADNGFFYRLFQINNQSQFKQYFKEVIWEHAELAAAAAKCNVFNATAAANMAATLKSHALIAKGPEDKNAIIVMDQEG